MICQTWLSLQIQASYLYGQTDERSQSQRWLIERDYESSLLQDKWPDVSESNQSCIFLNSFEWNKIMNRLYCRIYCQTVRKVRRHAFSSIVLNQTRPRFTYIVGWTAQKNTKQFRISSRPKDDHNKKQRLSNQTRFVAKPTTWQALVNRWWTLIRLWLL